MAPYNGLIKKGWNVLKQSSLSQQVCRVCLMRVQAISSVVDYILDSGSSRLFRQFRAYVIPVPETCYHLVLMEVAPCHSGLLAQRWKGLEGQVLLMMVLV